MSLTILRRSTQLLFIGIIFLTPVLNILRYDSDRKELFLLGKVYNLGIDKHNITDPGQIAWVFFTKALIPWLIALSIFPLLGFFLGRFFCGWLCPEGTLFEWADFLNIKLTGRRSIWEKGVEGHKERIYLIPAILSILIIPPSFGIALSRYFISPERIWRELKTLEISRGLMGGVTGVSLYIITTSIFIRHNLCKYVCAAGLMQMLFSWISPLSLRVTFATKEASSLCTDCRHCEKVCFMGLKPRRLKPPSRDIWCVNCGACLEACRKELNKKEGLFCFQFGEKQRPILKLKEIKID